MVTWPTSICHLILGPFWKKSLLSPPIYENRVLTRGLVLEARNSEKGPDKTMESKLHHKQWNPFYVYGVPFFVNATKLSFLVITVTRFFISTLNALI